MINKEYETFHHFLDLDKFEENIFFEKSVVDEESNSDELNGVSFQSALTDRNKRICQKAQDIFNQYFGDLSDMCLVYTGSDGRGEKLSSFSSPLELILITEQSYDECSEARSRIKALLLDFPHLFNSSVEFKCLKTDNMFTFTQQTPKQDRAFPTRALDAKYFAGSTEIFRSYKNKFFSELKSGENKKLLTTFKGKAYQPALSNLNKILLSTDNSNISLIEGSAFYDGRRVKSTKYSILRSLQYKLALIIVNSVQSNKLEKEEFDEIPDSIIDRLEWLRNRELINITKEFSKSLQNAYAVSLACFGICEKNFELLKKDKTEINIKLMSDVATIIFNFCKQN